MSKALILTITLIFILAISATAVAQEAELALYAKITSSIEKSEPAWELSRKAILPNQVVIRWTSGRERILVSVVLLPSESEATEAFKARVGEWMNMPESKVSKSEVKGLGVEGFWLRAEGGSGANIIFRKGNRLVEVSGPSEAIAERFARHISDLPPTSNRTLKPTARWQGFHR